MTIAKPLENPRIQAGLLLLTALLLYGIRLSGPSDLEGFAQNRNVGYVLDAVCNNHWLVQHDLRGRITSKPPLHTWAAAGAVKVFGLNRLSLTLPSLLAITATALLLLQVGRKYFGGMAGLLAGGVFLLATPVAKHIALVRTDALFMLAVLLTALAAWRSWNHGTGWVLFWTAGAFAALIKGPLGLLLGAAGLLAFFAERRTDPDTPRPAGRQAAGIAVFFLLCLGWLIPALWNYGADLFEKMFVEELWQHSAGVRRNSFPLAKAYKPTAYFFFRYLPFSIPMFYALWRTAKHPAKTATERRFERFLFCWLVTGILLFSLATHHRSDLLLPLWPAGALLAGREMVRFMNARSNPRRTALVYAAMVPASLLIAGWNYHVLPARRAEAVAASRTAREAARAIQQARIPIKQLLHHNTPETLQWYLGTHQPWTSDSEVQFRLQQQKSVLIATGTNANDGFLKALPASASINPLLVWPNPETPSLRILELVLDTE